MDAVFVRRSCDSLVILHGFISSVLRTSQPATRRYPSFSLPLCYVSVYLLVIAATLGLLQEQVLVPESCTAYLQKFYPFVSSCAFCSSDRNSKRRVSVLIDSKTGLASTVAGLHDLGFKIPGEISSQMILKCMINEV